MGLFPLYFIWKHWSQRTRCCTETDLWDFKEAYGHSRSSLVVIYLIKVTFFYGSGCKDFSWPNFALAHLFKDFNSEATGNSLNSTMTSICYLVKLSFVYILSLLFWYFVLGGIDALCWNHKFWLQNLPTLFPDRSPEVLFSCREWHCYKYVEILIQNMNQMYIMFIQCTVLWSPACEILINMNNSANQNLVLCVLFIPS